MPCTFKDFVQKLQNRGLIKHLASGRLKKHHFLQKPSVLFVWSSYCLKYIMDFSAIYDFFDLFEFVLISFITPSKKIELVGSSNF